MPKKTADKKPADKKDTGKNKKSNAGKDVDDSKVRRLVLVGFDLGSTCEVGGRETQGRNLGERSTHPLRGMVPSHGASFANLKIPQKHSKATEALMKIQVCAIAFISHP